MEKLGDFFTDDFRRSLAKSNLQIGAVFRYFVDFTTPPKTKYQIIVGFDNQSISLVTVLINTEINPNLFKKESLKNLHFLLKKESNDFLEYDSFVYCGQLHEQKIAEVEKVIQSKISTFVGNLSEETFEQIKILIKNAKSIEEETKEKYNLA
jgi:uncharacterized protein YuzB (UPF0349 family)